MGTILSVILPCYDPASGWTDRVLANVALIQKDIQDVEVILVNDGSSQDLSSEIKLLSDAIPNFKSIQYSHNKGKGYALRQGLTLAQADHIIYTDIDFPYTHDSFLKVRKALDQYDVVIGIKDAAYHKSLPLFRRWVSSGLRTMTSKLMELQITDTQCGLKGLNAQVKDIWLSGKVDGYLFEIEAIRKAEKSGCTLLPLPVTLREGVVFSELKAGVLFKELKHFIQIALKK
ncbi:MAG: glycosyltransferase family 2 protein [Bacteroidota bacterium]